MCKWPAALLSAAKHHASEPQGGIMGVVSIAPKQGAHASPHRVCLHHCSGVCCTADFTEYSLRYSLPSISIKGCCYPLMVAGVPGFDVSLTRAQLQQEGKEDVRDVSGVYHNPVAMGKPA